MRMLTRALLSLHRMVLVAAIAVALVATGYGHRMPSDQDAALAFALENGVSVAEFCGDVPGGPDKGGVHCPACQIAGTADLPVAPAALIDLELAFVARVVAPRESREVLRALDPANSPQGPPVA